MNKLALIGIIFAAAAPWSSFSCGPGSHAPCKSHDDCGIGEACTFGECTAGNMQRTTPDVDDAGE